jgi:hypothetical protein
MVISISELDERGPESHPDAEREGHTIFILSPCGREAFDTSVPLRLPHESRRRLDTKELNLTLKGCDDCGAAAEDDTGPGDFCACSRAGFSLGLKFLYSFGLDCSTCRSLLCSAWRSSVWAGTVATAMMHANAKSSVLVCQMPSPDSK